MCFTDMGSATDQKGEFMFTEIWPLLVLMGVAAAIPILLLGAKRKRENHCGKNPLNCLWCGRDCEYYRLHKLS